MKKMRGFTLSEVLICIAIIAVVSAFGGSIMKKTTANAYKMYIKSGYENLYDALMEIMEDENIKTTASLQNELNKIFNMDNDKKTTKNGIKYEVTAANGNGSFIIEMTVPQQKTRNNSNGKSTAAFLFNTNGDGYLIPLNVNAAGYIPNLQTRADLIPFYIDDSEVGKYDGHTYKKIVPTNYRDAACKINGSLNITVPSKYASENAASASVWGGTEKSVWNFNGGKLARIINCTGITIDQNANEYTVAPYYGR